MENSPENVVFRLFAVGLREKTRVTVWNEFLHEKKDSKITKIYPEEIHGAIAKYLRSRPCLDVRTATSEEPVHGLTGDVLNSTDVQIWWGRPVHDKVSDAVLHSAHYSKIFRRLLGTSCSL